MENYTIKRIDGTPDWDAVESLELSNHLWLESSHISATAKICYDPSAIYVRMVANEPEVRAEHTDPLSAVCEDSCMEFFFCPVPNDDRYINFEINPNACTCIGVGYGRADRIRLIPKKEDILFDKQARLTPTGWETTYKIPLTFLQSLFPNCVLESGIVLRANCFKCGDKTVKPHYLSWNYVDHPTPDFHRSCDFGVMVLE